MASQESKEGVGEVAAVETGQMPTTETQPERSVDTADSRRIGPWHPPDYNRQRVLADRLSNPALRAQRPTQSASAASDRNRTLDPYSLHSPYHKPRSRATTASSTRMNANGSNSRVSSGPPGSPRSPRRQPSTPRYGSMSPRRQPPLFPTPATTRKVTDEELDNIVERVTRPTVSSRGGVDLLDKDFTYIQTPRLKTLPVVPGLERRYLGLQKVDSTAMEEIVYRLTRLTSAYKAKFAPNKNVYIDMEPGAHMVQRRTQSAV